VRSGNIPEKTPRVEGPVANLGGMFRVLLPPNLVAAAARDAVAVKIEFDPAAGRAADLAPAFAWLQDRLGAPARSPAFLQLTRAHLRDFTELMENQPVFFWVNRPTESLAWREGLLAGVSEHLAEPEAPESPPPPSAPAAPGAFRRPPAAPVIAGTPLIVDGSEHYLALTLPSREHPTYDEALALARKYDFILETTNRRWWLRDRHKTLNFLAAQWSRLREHFGAQFTANFEKNTARLRLATVRCAAAEAGGEFEVTLELQTGGAAPGAVSSALDGGRSYVEDGGDLVLLPPATVERLAQAQRQLLNDAAGMVAPRRTVRIGGARLAEADAVLASLAPDFRPPEVWQARSAALRRIGVAWLWHLHRHGLGGILADEMGLGKTLEALALLSALRVAKSQIPDLESQTSGPCLVVCPASLVENWRREAARFAPSLRVLAHHGGDRAGTGAAFQRVDLVITSYGTLVRDRPLFESVEFACAIGDEAQHIKNRRTQHATALRALHARGRFLLTGTPVENRLDDLRSLFDFLMPGYLATPPAGSRGDERAWFDERLRTQTAPYILRRTKTAVAPELPPKIEQTLVCELSPAQAALYREWRERGERELDALAASGASEGRLRLAALTQLLRLRQVCCDPRLVEKLEAASETDVGRHRRMPPIDDLAGSGPAAEAPAKAGDAALPSSDAETPGGISAKLDAFRELVEEAIDDGHRLLVFSQFTSLLALLRRELEMQGLAYCYLDGTMLARARHAEIDRFQQGTEIPIFLLSLKAGGTGLNLTGADVVVHFDPWWNPAVEAQATDRAHRIGQKRAVTSYKLICAGTVEEKVLELQDAKRALLADVFEASEAAAAGLSLADLRGLME
jgi:hypothetical protein